MRNYFLPFCCCIVFFAGCATSPEETEQAVEEATQASLPETPIMWSSIAAEVGPVQIGWLESLNDPKLRELVEEAQIHNRSLQAVAANVDRARALADKAGAALMPQVNLTGDAGRGGMVEGNSQSDFSLGVQASWELDLWGRVRSGEYAASNQLAAMEADYRYAQEALAANVARAWFVYAEAILQEQVAAEMLQMLEESNRIVQVRFENGMGSQQDVSLARSDLATASDRRLAARSALQDAARSLELLLGRYPSAEVDRPEGLANVPPLPPAGLPSEMLERRPDLVAAERRIASAFNLVDQAEAARLPQFSLTAGIGGSSNSLKDVLNPSNMAWQAASNLLAPLFDGGRRQAEVEAASADQRAAIALYADAALKAFAEVEKALDDTALLAERAQFLKSAVDEAENAYRVASLNYDEGEIDLLSLLTIQQRVNQARSSLLSIQRSQLSVFVDLNMALGGGWQ